MHKKLYLYLASILTVSSSVACAQSAEDAAIGKQYRSGPAPSCQIFEPATVTSFVSSSCSACSAVEIANASDGNLTTAATLNLTSVASTPSVSVRSTSTQSYPGGITVAAAVEFPEQLNPETRIAVSTYFQGNLQEQIQPGGFVGPRPIGTAFYGFHANKKFDAIEFTLYASSISGIVVNGTEVPPVAAKGVTKVYEFCSGVN